MAEVSPSRLAVLERHRAVHQRGLDALGLLHQPARTTRHVCSNVVITLESADTARGVSAMLLFTGAAAPLVGSFHDRFVRTAEGWRFAERRGSLTFAP